MNLVVKLYEDKSNMKYIYTQEDNSFEFKELFNTACTWVENNLTLIHYRKIIKNSNRVTYTNTVKSIETVNLYINIKLPIYILAVQQAFTKYNVKYQLFYYNPKLNKYTK